MSDTHDPYQALRFSGFRLLLIGIFIAGLGEKMIDGAIGWELYERTGSALVLGGVGLALVIPFFSYLCRRAISLTASTENTSSSSPSSSWRWSRLV